MLKQMLICTSLLAPALAVSADLSAAEYGTSAEAKAMLERAVAAVRSDRTGAIARFNHNNPEFRDRDLYVFCFNALDGKLTAHEAMVDRDVRTFRDGTGAAFGEEIYQRASEDRVVTIAYLSPLPGSTRQVRKLAYVTKIGDQVCGVSAYQFDGQRAPSQ